MLGGYSAAIRADKLNAGALDFGTVPPLPITPPSRYPGGAPTNDLHCS